MGVKGSPEAQAHRPAGRGVPMVLSRTSVCLPPQLWEAASGSVSGCHCSLGAKHGVGPGSEQRLWTPLGGSCVSLVQTVGIFRCIYVCFFSPVTPADPGQRQGEVGRRMKPKGGPVGISRTPKRCPGAELLARTEHSLHVTPPPASAPSVPRTP